VTLLLLALLAREDGWRADWVPSPTEGWLNLLLPLAWACLVALAVEQEPLTGDQQFWLTRPYRRPALFAAKALFVVLFIHIPSFIADCYILSAREFSALVYLPQLLWKQVLLGAALTLPALALAAMSRSFAHFMLAVFAIAAAIAFLTGGFPNPPLPWQAVDNVRHAVIVAVIAAAAGGITLLQFTRRRTGAARVIGIASALAAGTMSAYMPVTYTFALRSAMQPGPAQAVLRLVPPEERSSVPAPLWSGSEMITAALPVAISGIPHSAEYRVEQLEVEIVGPHGERYRTPKRSSYRPFDKVMLDTYMWSPKSEDRSPSWLILRINRSVHEQIRDGAVKIAGKAAITFYRLGAPAWMNAVGGVSVPAAGQCSSHLVDGRWSEAMLKVECESPTPIPLFTRVRLGHPETGKNGSSD